jgi:hypothetical protein
MEGDGTRAKEQRPIRDPSLLRNQSNWRTNMKILIAGFVSLVLIAPLARRLAIEKLESRRENTPPNHPSRTGSEGPL